MLSTTYSAKILNYLLILLLDVQEHEVRLKGSSKSHCPIDVTSLELSVFINEVVRRDMELCEALLLVKKIKRHNINVSDNAD